MKVGSHTIHFDHIGHTTLPITVGQQLSVKSSLPLTQRIVEAAAECRESRDPPAAALGAGAVFSVNDEIVGQGHAAAERGAVFPPAAERGAAVLSINDKIVGQQGHAAKGRAHGGDKMATGDKVTHRVKQVRNGTRHWLLRF